jgi:hypothetical protein
MMMDRLSVLVETDVLGLLTEALTAQVEVVLSDETGLVLADTAGRLVSTSNIRIVYRGMPVGGHFLFRIRRRGL